MSDSIEEIKKIVGAELPEDLMQFYAGAFGEIEMPAEIAVPDSSPWIDRVEWLCDADDALAFLREDVRSLEYETRQFPARSIPIGYNGNSDFYIVSLRDSDFGSVLYRFHELCDPMDDSIEGAIVLAPNLTKWIGSFRPEAKGDPTPDWEAINQARLDEILHPKPPWWKFWATRTPWCNPAEPYAAGQPATRSESK